MNPLTRDDLLSLEDYARERGDFRTRVMAHKKARTVHVGDHLTLVFEDRLSMHYQIQEMLRIERIFESEGIEDELNAYNPLIPDGSNLKATLMVTFSDPEVRRRELVRLRGLEQHMQIQVEGHQAVTALADEDMDRSDPHKTSAVHFLRFELTAQMIGAWRNGSAVTVRCTLPAEPCETMLDELQQEALAKDFD